MTPSRPISQACLRTPGPLPTTWSVKCNPGTARAKSGCRRCLRSINGSAAVLLRPNRGGRRRRRLGCSFVPDPLRPATDRTMARRRRVARRVRHRCRPSLPAAREGLTRCSQSARIRATAPRCSRPLRDAGPLLCPESDSPLFSPPDAQLVGPPPAFLARE
jgi:hypothetical protein